MGTFSCRWRLTPCLCWHWNKHDRNRLTPYNQNHSCLSSDRPRPAVSLARVPRHKTIESLTFDIVNIRPLMRFLRIPTLGVMQQNSMRNLFQYRLRTPPCKGSLNGLLYGNDNLYAFYNYILNIRRITSSWSLLIKFLHAILDQQEKVQHLKRSFAPTKRK